ncbi:MAG: hypothetical protein JXA30_17325 [Deltaproteobacteria bacterium]|nr:hypothetical protein [Deltaproteobacteria bacterium]
MRLKIIAGNLAVVVLLGLIAYITVRNGLRSELAQKIDSSLENEQVLLDRSFQLAALTFMENTTERAGSAQVRDVFAGLDQNVRRTRAYEAAEDVFNWFANLARDRRKAPDIVVIVDETGTTLARNGARNVMYGKNLLSSLPALKQVLRSGSTEHDVWLEENENKVLQTAIAPIRGSSGLILGALIVGYDLSNGVAKSEAQVLGRDVAFVIKDRVYSSSLEGEAARDLMSFLFGSNKTSTEGILSGSAERSQLWLSTFAREQYIGITARLPMSRSLSVAYVVLGNRTVQMAPASRANVIIYMLVLGSILVIVYGFIIGTTFLRPIEMIEEGVLAVINGRTDLRLETGSPELGGLAYRINQLLNVFTGTEEETEDANGRVSLPPGNGWKEAEFADSPVKPSSNSDSSPTSASGDEPIEDAELASKLDSEDEHAYRARIYSEYFQAKQALGENVSNITNERFHQRLAGRADALTKRYGCKRVRFVVQTQNNQVTLRPVIIR